VFFSSASVLQTLNIVAFPTIFSDGPKGLGSNKARLPGVPLHSTPGHFPAALRAAGIDNQQSAIGLRAKPALRF